MCVSYMIVLLTQESCVDICVMLDTKNMKVSVNISYFYTRLFCFMLSIWHCDRYESVLL